jgi:dTDP-4-dehydrorhamnose reductase
MNAAATKELILGATGMLGSAMTRVLSRASGLRVVAAARSGDTPGLFEPGVEAEFVTGVDVADHDSLAGLFAAVRPDVTINCIGLIKQLADADEVLAAVPINSLLPHRLARLCQIGGGRLVHISTDCVFSGSKGDYRETDRPDATDVYGLSKYLGEVEGPNAVTLRTSIIGHELRTRHGLLEWFLAQDGPIQGYARAIFSGFPTVELARIVRDHVIPVPDLKGLYHVSAEPISKYDLLHLFAAEYGRMIEIERSEEVRIDRSLNSERFRAKAGYAPPPWSELVSAMRRFG